MLNESGTSTSTIAKPYATSKAAAPSLPGGIVQRERLFGLLDHNREKPVVWITGPGGSGKTTLAATYLKARNLPCFWYQVDEKDADPVAFFYHTWTWPIRSTPPAGWSLCRCTLRNTWRALKPSPIATLKSSLKIYLPLI